LEGVEREGRRGDKNFSKLISTFLQIERFGGGEMFVQI